MQMKGLPKMHCNVNRELPSEGVAVQQSGALLCLCYSKWGQISFPYCQIASHLLTFFLV